MGFSLLGNGCVRLRTAGIAAGLIYRRNNWLRSYILGAQASCLLLSAVPGLSYRAIRQAGMLRSQERD